MWFGLWELILAVLWMPKKGEMGNHVLKSGEMQRTLWGILMKRRLLLVQPQWLETLEGI